MVVFIIIIFTMTVYGYWFHHFQVVLYSVELTVVIFYLIQLLSSVSGYYYYFTISAVLVQSA